VVVRLRALTPELVRARVDVIFAAGPVAIRAARQATAGKQTEGRGQIIEVRSM
jgi:hypothetical protein